MVFWGFYWLLFIYRNHKQLNVRSMTSLKAKIDTCVIAAGGQGTRLRALDPDRPKALTPILGEPILSCQINLLVQSGINNFHLLLNYHAEQIINFIESNLIEHG